MTGPSSERSWWKESIVYQIYPRSFNDSDGDGIGDIPGIVEKLDYLDELGIDVVWLNPVYESPNADNGYDIADYRSVAAEFGTMDDWEELLAGLHERDIKLVMDLVVNHTSDEHEWFRESRQSTDSDYRDYYIWREGREVDCDGGPRGPDGEAPPNNWESFFGGPAWSYDEATGEWYLHIFDEKQPDLNWENPAVREEIYEMMEWWLGKGIDGFRMDVINIISKPEGLPDGEDDGAVVRGAEQFVNGPRIHEFLREMYDRVLAGRDVMTVGEMVDLSVEEAREYVGEDGDGMSMAFNFDHLRLDFGPHGRWDRGEWTVRELKGTITHWQRGLAEDGWNSVHLNNHDQPRMVSRFGDDGEYRRESAKLLGTLTHTLRGTPYVYQGEELGMTNYPFESLDEVRDVDTLQNVATAKLDGRIETREEALDLVRYRSRDNARTPMQWSSGERAGFTDDEPWIPVNPNRGRINAERARADEDSVWHYYRRLVELREEHDVLVYGDYDLLLAEHEEVWAYARTRGDERALVVLNFGDGRPRFDPPAEFDGEDAELLICNYEAAASAVEPVELRPWEARVYRLTG
ncbi:glycoside hydrolase family 13 protein [Halegenticoccus soli]|uniref:glycoside hydrolase family 13 protein n=1 Tax=Halegenticoccus soli TaxID=1985678 RepID=UPI000C6ED610|nr:alpha-glucosidase [Halegenticoccus soli]